MSNSRILDVQDKLDDAVRAFDGLCDLFNEVEAARTDEFQVLRPHGVAELMRMVGGRFREARDMLDSVRGEIVAR